jgi:GDPmannose 4,6-dehydratase
MGAAICLEAIRQFAPLCRFYQAGSSEQFGNSALQKGKDDMVILNEDSLMHPRSPYGVAKQMAYDLTRNYREAYGIFAVAGLLFNHESPYRGEEFVTRKITKGIAAVLAGEEEVLKLGNLSACRDWGHAEDYMRAAWMMLQQDNPYDYVIATGETYSVKQFVERACHHAGVDDPSSIIRVDEDLYRPSEIHVLIGDSRRARRNLGWEPAHTFDDLVYHMVRQDLERYSILSHLRE